jgi:hypothetical protein
MRFEPYSSTGSAESPSDAEISRVMGALGRRGGQVGGRARADSLTVARRKEIAQKAARSRRGEWRASARLLADPNEHVPRVAEPLILCLVGNDPKPLKFPC